MKRELLGSRFATEIEVEVEINTYLASKSSDWFYHGIEMYKDKIKTCFWNKGD